MDKFDDIQIDITPKKYDDNSLCPLGKYKAEGVKLGDVPASYLLWLYNQPWLRSGWTGLYNYITASMGAIRLKVKEEFAERMRRRDSYMARPEEPQKLKDDYEQWLDTVDENDIPF